MTELSPLIPMFPSVNSFHLFLDMATNSLTKEHAPPETPLLPTQISIYYLNKSTKFLLKNVVICVENYLMDFREDI